MTTLNRHRIQQSKSYSEKKKAFGFDFYKRRSSTSSKDTLTNPSSELLTPYARDDPVNAYNPLVSVYYLVREKIERDNRAVENRGQDALIEKPLPMAAPRQPEAAHTNQASYEVKGEPQSTSGRTRPRARTHGDDEVTEAMKSVNIGGASTPASASVGPPPREHQPPPAPVRKDLSVGGMFRRLSSRRHASPRDNGKSTENSAPPPPPQVSVQPPDQPPTSLRKSLSVRHPKEPPRTNPVHPDLLTPPASSDGARKSSKPLGRSTSVSEADWRRRYVTRPRTSMEPPRVNESGSQERSVSATRPDPAEKSFAVRAKSVGHAKREMIQSRN